MNTKDYLTDTLLVASMTLLGYLTGFSYEYGYLSHFDIPAELIELDVTRVLISIAAVFATGWIFMAILNFLSLHGLFSNDTALNRSRKISGLFLTYGLFVFFLYRGQSHTLVLLIVVCLLSALEFLLPYFRRDKKTWEEKLLAQEEVEKKLESKSLVALIAKQMGLSAFRLAFISLAVVFIAFQIGNSEALNQKEFLVIQGMPERVVLRIYKDTMILGSVNRSTKTLTGQIFLLERDTVEGGVLLDREEIGPLVK